jgi:endonuclease/exonuclease/phosphatase family metal-dependent hydrolase
VSRGLVAATALVMAVTPTPATGSSTFQVLQMNLCNTGNERMCYRDGRSIAEAVQIIASVAPDVVTVNEVCEDDMVELAAALGGTTNVHFEPIRNSRTEEVVRCADGEPSGDAVLLSPAHPLRAESSGRFSTENTPNQARVFTCVQAGTGDSVFYACATHLSLNNDTSVNQCRELMTEIVPAFRTATGVAAPVVVGGDFNLRDTGGRTAQECLPDATYIRSDDGEVQNVVAESPFRLGGTEVLPMQQTDHPALVVRLDAPW